MSVGGLGAGGSRAPGVEGVEQVDEVDGPAAPGQAAAEEAQGVLQLGCLGGCQEELARGVMAGRGD